MAIDLLQQKAVGIRRQSPKSWFGFGLEGHVQGDKFETFDSAMFMG